MVGDSPVALKARIEPVTASKADCDDVEVGVVVGAAGLWIDVETMHLDPVNLPNHYSSSPIGRR
ncbi:hypothetical protein ABTH90_17445, partial [Acinetobacter baumannii]